MKCPNCDHLMCSGCGESLRVWNTPQDLCDDHVNQYCNECAWDIVDEERCMDCVRIREEESSELAD